MAEKVRLGIIGLGAEGGMYLRILASGAVPNMEVGAICDILPEKKARADELGVPFYENYIDMLESGNVDSVVTTTPHYLHPEMGIESLKRGERPPAGSAIGRVCSAPVGGAETLLDIPMVDADGRDLPVKE